MTEQNVKRYTVTKRVVIEYRWEVEADSKEEAINYAMDLGEPSADELTNVRETVTAKRA